MATRTSKSSKQNIKKTHATTQNGIQFWGSATAIAKPDEVITFRFSPCVYFKLMSIRVPNRIARFIQVNQITIDHKFTLINLGPIDGEILNKLPSPDAPTIVPGCLFEVEVRNTSTRTRKISVGGTARILW